MVALCSSVVFTSNLGTYLWEQWYAIWCFLGHLEPVALEVHQGLIYSLSGVFVRWLNHYEFLLVVHTVNTTVNRRVLALTGLIRAMLKERVHMTLYWWVGDSQGQASVAHLLSRQVALQYVAYVAFCGIFKCTACTIFPHIHHHHQDVCFNMLSLKNQVWWNSCGKHGIIAQSASLQRLFGSDALREHSFSSESRWKHDGARFGLQPRLFSLSRLKRQVWSCVSLIVHGFAVHEHNTFTEERGSFFETADLNLVRAL